MPKPLTLTPAELRAIAAALDYVLDASCVEYLTTLTLAELRTIRTVQAKLHASLYIQFTLGE